MGSGPDDETKNRISEEGQNSHKVEFGAYTPGDERTIVPILAFCHGEDWKGEEYWRWKHLHRPGFIREDVVTAYADGKMVGCFHGAILPFRVEDGLDVPMSFDGDYAMLPAYRGRGGPVQVNALTNRRLLERGIVVRGGFATKTLYDGLYRWLGYIFLPGRTATFRKILSLRPLQRKVEELGAQLLAQSRLRRALVQHPMVVDLRIDTLPPCHLELTAHAFCLREGGAPNPCLRIRAPYSLLAAFVHGLGAFVKSAVLNLLMGRLRIRGLLRNGPSLLKVLWLCARL